MKAPGRPSTPLCIRWSSDAEVNWQLKPPVAGRLYGVTFNEIWASQYEDSDKAKEELMEIEASLADLSQKPTTRVVFDEGEPATPHACPPAHGATGSGRGAARRVVNEADRPSASMRTTTSSSFAEIERTLRATR